ncbi:hypothetical protein HDU83_005707 [Entophlyctis luteolus]|nr:hypothetical protein HDU83_005707 [Entophlyctis luteolus]
MEATDSDNICSLAQPLISPGAPVHPQSPFPDLHEHTAMSTSSPPAPIDDSTSSNYHQMVAYLEFVSMQSTFPPEPFFPFAYPMVYDNMPMQVAADASYFMYPDAVATAYSGLQPHELLEHHEYSSPASTTAERLHMDQPLLLPLLTHQHHQHTPSESASPPGDSDFFIALTEITHVKSDERSPPEVGGAPSPPKSPCENWDTSHETAKKSASEKKSPLSRTAVAGRKQKSPRFKATQEELKFLMSVFETNPFPNAKMRQFISKKVGMSDKQVVVWFQNKRASCKVNGILAVKPKKGDSAGVVPGNLVQVSAENPFFFTKA